LLTKKLWKRIFSTSRNDFEIISYAYRSRHSFRQVSIDLPDSKNRGFAAESSFNIAKMKDIK
jgi:hypothetical protein